MPVINETARVNSKTEVSILVSPNRGTASDPRRTMRLRPQRAERVLPHRRVAPEESPPQGAGGRRALERRLPPRESRSLFAVWWHAPAAGSQHWRRRSPKRNPQQRVGSSTRDAYRQRVSPGAANTQLAGSIRTWVFLDEAGVNSRCLSMGCSKKIFGFNLPMTHTAKGAGPRRCITVCQ